MLYLPNSAAKRGWQHYDLHYGAGAPNFKGENKCSNSGRHSGRHSLSSFDSSSLTSRSPPSPPSFILSRRSLSIICIQAKPKRRSPPIGLASHDGPECGAHAFVSVAVCACPNSSSCRTCQRGFCCWIDPDSISLSLSFSSTSPANQMGENNKKKKKTKTSGTNILFTISKLEISHEFPTGF